MILNVLDFGVKADGITNDTQAINNVIEKANPGDIVYIPSGKYFVGSIFLKSNMTLKMDSDTLLLASSDINDYKAPSYLPDEDRKNVYGTQGVFSVLTFDNVYDVVIDGGHILFDDLAFDQKVENNPVIVDDNYVSGLEYFRKPTYAYIPISSTRPIGTYLIKCNNVKVKNLFYENVLCGQVQHVIVAI